MKISNVEAFLAEMDNYNAEYELDIEEGWTHEDVCKNSYTEQRLAWVFQHTKEQTDEIANIVKPECKALKVKSVVYDDGSVSTGKFCIN